ncbi:PxKF domain-containing protein (plasmid) [Deinococcus radiomollis]|uniref:PxKF domain-containing protein n=1 Tax=Deinococcus radiomollis TaxID=468916 RepID=UPI0038916E44
MANALALRTTDTIPPIITSTLSPAAPDGTNGWYKSPVTVTWTIATSSAISSKAGCDPTTLSADTTGTTPTCTATSAGGTSSKAVTVKVDVTRPTLTATFSNTVSAETLPNAVLLGSAVSVTPSATDATSGVASSSCTAPNTSTIGRHAVTCTASDNAGNITTVQVPYSVIYNFQGFSDPLSNLPAINSGKAGRAYPVKFTLTGQSSLNVLVPGYPKVTTIDCSATALVAENATTVSAVSNTGLKFDGSYTFVWKTDKTPGCYQLNVQLNDKTDHYALFNLR